MYSVVFIILTHFGAPGELFLGKAAHLPLNQPVCTNKI